MTKPTLADYLRLDLTEKYGSCNNACNFYNLPYESFKRSLVRNIFNKTILDALFPGVSLNELQEKYTFKEARVYKSRLGVNTVEIRMKSSLLHYLLSNIDTEDARLIGENKLVAEKIAVIIRSTCTQIREALR